MLDGDPEALKKRYELARARLITARLEVQLYGGHLLAMHPDRYTLADIGRMSVESGPSVPEQESIMVVEDEKVGTRVGTTPPPPPTPTPPMPKEVASPQPEPWEKGLKMARKALEARNRAKSLDEKLAKLNGKGAEGPAKVESDPVVSWAYGPRPRRVQLQRSLIEEFKQLETFTPTSIRDRIAAHPAYSMLGLHTLRNYCTAYAKYLVSREGYVELAFGYYGRPGTVRLVRHHWCGKKRVLDRGAIEAIRRMCRLTPEGVRQVLEREVKSRKNRDDVNDPFIYLDYLIQEGSVKRVGKGRYVSLSPKALAEIAKYDEFRTQDLTQLVRDFEPELQAKSFGSSEARSQDYIAYLVASGQFVKVGRGLYKTPQRIEDTKPVKESEPMPHIIDGIVTYEDRPEEGYGRK